MGTFTPPFDMVGLHILDEAMCEPSGWLDLGEVAPRSGVTPHPQVLSNLVTALEQSVKAFVCVVLHQLHVGWIILTVELSETLAVVTHALNVCQIVNSHVGLRQYGREPTTRPTRLRYTHRCAELGPTTQDLIRMVPCVQQFLSKYEYAL